MVTSGNLLVIFSALMTFTQLRTVEGLKCYTCAGCNDKFDPKTEDYLVEYCSGSCMKVKIDGYVTRSCSQTKMTEDCQESEQAGHEEATCYCHSKNYCNGSAPVKVTVTTILVLVINYVRKFL